MIRVAVFGGDGRGHYVERASEHCVVTAYEGDDRNAERVAQAARQGTFTHVVALKRWMNHPQWHKLHDACKEANVTFVTWTRGLGSLKSEIEGWIEALPPQTVEKEEGKQMSHRAMNGLWVESSENKPALISFKGITQQVQDAFALDLAKEWTIESMSEFLYNVSDKRTMKNMSMVFSKLLERGVIVQTGGKHSSAKDPRRFRLVAAVSGKQTLAENAAELEKAARVLKKLDVNYISVNSAGSIRNYFKSQQAALDYIKENPSDKLYREVPLRVSIEIDE